MKAYSSKFLNNFNDEEKEKIINYFNNLNNNVFLTAVDTKLLDEDFEKAINYYLNHGYKLDSIIDILSINNLGTYHKDSVSNWYPLDNAAKIYPLSMKESWMSVFRLSYYLKEDVVPEILSIALTFTIKRFPTFSTSIRKGFFWNYIDGIRKRFHVYKDNKLPCSFINVSNIGKQSFKTVYYKNRISIEYFHILTDGYGGVVFLSTLVAEYLRLLGKNVSYNEIVLNINNDYSKDEIKDEFTERVSSNKSKSLVDSKALEIDGKLSNIRPCQLLHFDMNIDSIKSLCKKNDCSVTELILTFIFMCCSFSTSKDGYIKIQVPVNMRKFYPSKTLRNFSLYVVISIKRKNITDFDDVLLEVKKQMKEKITKVNLDNTMTYTNRLVKSIKCIPLFIKRPIALIVYGYLGDKVITTVLSNLGNINIPDDMKRNIEKMDFSLGTGITNKVLFSMLTCNNILTLSITKFTRNKSVENSLYNILEHNNIKVKVYGSDEYEN